MATASDSSEVVPGSIAEGVRESRACDDVVPAPGSKTGETVSRLASALLLFFFEGASVAGAIQLGVYRRQVDALVRNNQMDLHDRWLLVGSMTGAGLAACLAALIFLAVRRREESVRSLSRISHGLAPLLLAMGIPLLFNWRVFEHLKVTCIVFAALYGLAAEQTFRTCFRVLPWRRIEGWLRPLVTRGHAYAGHATFGLVGLGAAAFAVYFAYYTILHHHRIQTQSLDMGLFNNMMWRLARGEWFTTSPMFGPTDGSHLQFHATFIAYLIVPVYALWQQVENLLVIQAVVCGSGAIPVYLLIARRVDSRWVGVAFAYAYLVFSPQHAAIFYDFHFLTLAPTFVAWSLYALERGSRVGLAIAWVLALLVREDVAASLAFAGLFYLLAGKRPWAAIAATTTAALYFVFVKFHVMPGESSRPDDTESFAHIFKELIPPGERGFGPVFRTVVSNPVFVLIKMLETPKLTYLLAMLGPVVMLPIRDRRAWILIAFPAAFVLLSTGYQPIVELTFQYTALWTSYVFIASAWTLASWRNRPEATLRIAAVVCAMLLTSTALSYNFGAVFQHHTFRGGFRKVEFVRSEKDRQRFDDLQQVIAMIPPSARVAATETEVPHVSSRKYAYTIRLHHHDAEYLLINGAEVRSGFVRKQVLRALQTNRYGFVAARGDFTLWKLDAAHDDDAVGYAVLGLNHAPEPGPK